MDDFYIQPRPDVNAWPAENPETTGIPQRK
jgi:hypothetical protein